MELITCSLAFIGAKKNLLSHFTGLDQYESYYLSIVLLQEFSSETFSTRMFVGAVLQCKNRFFFGLYHGSLLGKLSQFFILKYLHIQH